MSAPNLDLAPLDRPPVTLLGVDFSPVTMAETIDTVRQSMRAGEGGWILATNLDQMRLMHANPEAWEICKKATILASDGVPLIWASKLQGTPLPDRVTGSDLISDLAAVAADEGVGIFMLGGDPGTAEAAAAVFEKRHPGIRIAGTVCPPFGFDKDEQQVAELRRQVTESGAGLVYVALGFPKQEILMDKLRQTMPNAWFLGVGISFSFVSGEVKRAPKWMQRAGLEWVHRLQQEPKRLGRRYLRDDPPFALNLFASALATRLRGTRRRSPPQP